LAYYKERTEIKDNPTYSKMASDKFNEVVKLAHKNRPISFGVLSVFMTN
jgi:hypothetical protein